MAVLPIRSEPDPVLRRWARPVEKITKRIVKLAHDMLETMYHAQGVGLAAPQVGVSQRLVVVDVGEGPLILVNPELVAQKGSSTDVEGCLSVPGVTGYVTRAEQVVVRGLDLKGHALEVRGDALLARALQHELDHLNGVLFVDKATGLTVERGRGQA